MVGGGPGWQSRVNNDLNQFDTFSLPSICQLCKENCSKSSQSVCCTLRATFSRTYFETWLECISESLSCQSNCRLSVHIKSCKSNQYLPDSPYQGIPRGLGPTYIPAVWACEQYNAGIISNLWPPLDRAQVGFISARQPPNTSLLSRSKPHTEFFFGPRYIQTYVCSNALS